MKCRFHLLGEIPLDNVGKSPKVWMPATMRGMTSRRPIT
jgi:hypothetical protein